MKPEAAACAIHPAAVFRLCGICKSGIVVVFYCRGGEWEQEEEWK